MAQAMLTNIFSQESLPPQEYRVDYPYIQREYLCNGVIKKWEGPLQDIHSPICASGSQAGGAEPVHIGSYPLLTQREAQEALEAACDAYDYGRGAWPTMDVEERIRHVEAFTYRMKEQRELVVNLLMWEIGKSLPDAQKEFDRTVEYINNTIDALKQLDRSSSRFQIEQSVIGQIRRAPLGVALCMGPYNYPLNETFTLLLPALIMGNTVIFKPPRRGVLLHQPLLQAFRDSFPPGVVNTVYGKGSTVIGPLMESGRIDILAFIGSSQVADTLRKQHPKPHRLRCVLGLEAKNIGIVLENADLENAVQETVLGALSYNGQRCTALKMMFVHQNILDEYLQKLTKAVEEIKIGMPWEQGVKITPMPDTDAVAELQELIKDATDCGARILNHEGGSSNQTAMVPAVLYPVQPGMRLYQEEQFGPIIPVTSFSDISEPMEYIKCSDYGQQTSIFGRDPDEIASLIDPMVNNVCRVNINSQCQRGPDVFPFTGRKASAEGTLSISDALLEFSIRSMVAAKENPTNREIVKEILADRKSRFLSTDFIF